MSQTGQNVSVRKRVMTFALVESAWYDATNFMLEPMLGLLACSIVRSQTEGTAEWKQP